MKIFIASDIHGSAKYCRMMLEAYEREGAGRMLLLGDILYHGPRNDLPEEYAPKKVIEMLNAKKDEIYSLRGNCEAEVDQMVLGFPTMADYALIPVGKRMIFATHGHVFNCENIPPMKKGDILLHGHTHIPVCERFGDDYVYMNPGSVSIPKQNSKHGYMTLEDEIFKWKDLEGREYMSFDVL
ncbi:MAG: phosphodiesterase [Lachnospiraceae bacterium]|nr:phosphodiesterase [Lachnospiraceae bacterium]